MGGTTAHSVCVGAANRIHKLVTKAIQKQKFNIFVKILKIFHKNRFLSKNNGILAINFTILVEADLFKKHRL